MDATTAQTRTHIRWCIRLDVPAVLAAEASWGLTDELDGKTLPRWPADRQTIGMVAEPPGNVHEPVYGFTFYELHKHHLRLLRLCIHRDFARRGHGTDLILKLTSKLSSHRRTRIDVDVPDGRLGAHLFLARLGFRAAVLDRETYRFTYRLAEED